MNRSFFGQLADWELARRRPLTVALVAISAFALWLLLGLQFDFRPEALLEFSPEEEAFAAAFREEFKVDDNVLLLVLRGSQTGSVLDERGLTLLHRLTELAAANEIAASAVSLTTLPARDAVSALSAFTLTPPPPLIEALPITSEAVAQVRRQVASSRLIPGQLVSEDAGTAAIVVGLQPQFEDHSLLDRPLAELETEARALLGSESASLSANGGDPPAIYDLHFGGLPFVRVETVRNLKSEQRTFWPLTALLYLAVLWLIYRDLLLSAVPLLAVGLASLWGLALLPATGSKINVVNNIVPTLILVIGVCNAIHMLHGYRSARRAGLAGPDAARRMMEVLGLPAFLTSITTAIGFASLLVARNDTLRDLGWQAAAGIMFSWLALVTLFPLVLSSFGGRTRIERFDRGATAWEGKVELPWLEHVVAAAGRRPAASVALALATLAAALAIGSRVPIDATMIDTFPPGHPIYESNRLVEDKLGGTLPLEVELKGPRPGYFVEPETLERVFALQRALAEQPGVIHVSSLVDLVAEVQGLRDDDAVRAALTKPKIQFALGTLGRYQPGALERFVSADRSRLRLAVRMRDAGIRATLRTLDRIEERRPEWLEPFGGEVDLRLTGQAHIAARGLDYFIRDLFLSLLTASVVIFLVVVVVFRSLRMGLISVLPTILPLALTLAVIPIYGYQLNTTTTIVFTITIGMAVDNTIHLLSRFRMARRDGLGLEEAIQHTFRHAGAAVVASNLLLMAGFSILFLSDFEPVFRVAALTSTTIGAALVTAILVLPGLLKLFGEPIGNDRNATHHER